MRIKKVTANDAAEFIDLIRLSHSIWQMEKYINPHWQSREIWGFRGQRETEWQLIPSAFRKETILGYKPNSKSPPLDDNRQKEFERKAVVDFLFFADRIGLPVPGDGQHFRLPRRFVKQKVEEDIWPLDFELETLAIAQHHGVPTRLLDFSHNPIIAAYFACYGAWVQMGKPSINDSITNTRKLALWAVNLPLIFGSAHQAWIGNVSPRIIQVTVPRAFNTFLHHQDGFFLVDLVADKYGYLPLENAILDIQKELVDAGEDQFSDERIIKIELEWQFVPQVLDSLWNEYFHRARLQPTYDKAVESLEDYRALYKI